MGVTKVSDDAEEVGLQCFAASVSLGVNILLSRALTILEDLEDGGACVFLTVFARLKSGGRYEQGKVQL